MRSKYTKYANVQNFVEVTRRFSVDRPTSSVNGVSTSSSPRATFMIVGVCFLTSNGLNFEEEKKLFIQIYSDKMLEVFVINIIPSWKSVFEK